jgi:hypothetical protein
MARIRIGYGRTLPGDQRQAYSLPALEFYQEAVKSEPVLADLLNDCATALLVARPAWLRDAREAVYMAETAVNFTHSKKPAMLITLATSLRECGRPGSAATAGRTARRLRRDAAQAANFCR